MKEAAEQEYRQARENIRRKLALLPDKPGCYLMKNAEGTIIYVGKAKVLKNRVRSYFTGSHDGKTQLLVSQIRDFEYIVTASNVEALILECNLIKQHHPRYNVLLRDDKSFPYIKITNEEQPRLIVTRRIVKDKGKYFGPYPNAFAAQQTKKLLDKLYPLRKCRTLPDKVCLYYHLGQCLAPCVYDVKASENERMVNEITRFLSGGHEEIKKDLQRKMEAAAEALEFEKAKELRDQIAHIDVVMQKQTITMSDAQDRDIFGYAADKGWMCVQIMYMRSGKIIERRMAQFPFYGTEEEDFLTYVAQYYSDNPALPKELLLPEPELGQLGDAGQAIRSSAGGRAKLGGREGLTAEQGVQGNARDAATAEQGGGPDRMEDNSVEWTDASEADTSSSGETAGDFGAAELKELLESWLRVKVAFPKRGLKKQLLEMAMDNAKEALEQKFRLAEKDEERTIRAVEALGEWLDTGPVRRIEAFDNSNIQGTNPVSAMVVFTDGKPDRNQYRKYKIKTVKGANDVETMREVVRRRYERVLKEGLSLPDLIVVDGGKGQIAAAVDILENELGLLIPVCGLVKDLKHKTAQLLMGDPPEVIPLPRDSQEFYLLQRIQEEVHRFAISFHRQNRAKSMVASQLDAIPGIGGKRRKALLKHFGSLKKIREARTEDFRGIGIGDKLAQTILDALNEPSSDPDGGRNGDEDKR